MCVWSLNPKHLFDVYYHLWLIWSQIYPQTFSKIGFFGRKRRVILETQITIFCNFSFRFSKYICKLTKKLLRQGPWLNFCVQTLLMGNPIRHICIYLAVYRLIDICYLCVCMYVCFCACICLSVYIYVVFIWVCMDLWMYIIYVYMCKHVYIYVFMYIYVCRYLCIYVIMCICIGKYVCRMYVYRFM